MKKSIISLLAIILGIIIIAFPILGIIGVQAIIGVAVLLMGVFLLISGISEIDYSPKKSLVILIIGIAILIIGLLLLFSPEIFVYLAVLTVYLAGILLIIVGLITLIGNRNGGFAFWSGVVGVVLGIVYIILSSAIEENPVVLGALIGIWLILTGILRFVDS